jgi:hypothetical protein
MEKEFELGHEAIDYIRDRLSQGVSLSRLLLALPLEQGRVTTWLVEPITPEELTQFEDALDETVNKRAYMEELISTYLGNTQGAYPRYAIFENAAAHPTDPWVETRKVQFFTNSEQTDVYPFITSKNNQIANIRNAINNAVTAYLFTGILTEMENGPDIVSGQAVDTKTLQILAQNTAYMFISAYDGFGVLTWTR